VLGPVDYALWFAGAFMAASAVGCAIRSKSVRQYLPLVIYLAVTALEAVGRYVVFVRFGYSSKAYAIFYWISDDLGIISLYFGLMFLYSQVFKEMGVERYLRLGAVVLLACTAAVSAHMVFSSGQRLLTWFALELSQNLYFVGLVLTYILWGAVLKLRETRTRLIQFILALGVYFSGFAATYALTNFSPTAVIHHYLPQLLAFWLPAAWGYTFLKIPEEARLATARVAARNR
jgi:hypothetical protein